MLSNSSDYTNNLLNQLAYVDIGQNWEPGDNLCDVVERSGDSELAGLLRDAGFAKYTIKDYENNNSSNGFAAIAFENPETAEVGMSFRGTENLPEFGSDIGGILSGDDEAINNQIDMLDNASTAIAGDSSQARDALAFFERNRSTTGDNYLYGHSKGGELASQVYASYYFMINGVHVINPQPINTQRMTDEQKKAFQDDKFDAIVIDGDLVWKLGDAPYPVRIVQNNGSDSGFFGPHMLTSATYDDNGNAVIEEDPFKDYFWQKVAGEVAEFAISGLQELYVFVESFMARTGPVYVYRDFSEASKQKMLGLVTQVESEKWGDFTDWVGDRWYDFESWIGTLNIRNYINNVNTYHKKVIDKNNATEQTISRIFEAVWGVDASYAATLSNIRYSLEQWLRFVDTMAGIVEPGKGRFNGQYISGALNPILQDVSKANVQQIKDTLIQSVAGEPVFDEELLLEYIKKNPSQMTHEEKQALLEVIAELEETVAFYETAWFVGNNDMSAAFLNRAAWVSDTNKFASFSAVSAHYNELYVKVLEACLEQGEDSNTFAASLLKICNGEDALTILGLDCSADVSKIFGSASLAAYVAQWKTEHSEEYFAKLEFSEKNSGELLNDIKQVSDIKKAGNQWLEDNGLRKDEKITKFYDENGNEISDKEAGFYDRDYTIAEIDATASVSASIYEGKFDVGENGEINVVVGNAEAHAGISAGLYVIGADGEKQFMPGVNAEIGASVTAFEADWEQQWLGDENLGLNTEVGVTAGKVGGKGEVNAQLFSEDGKLDVQVNAEAKLEAIAVEAEGSVGVNVLGGEIEASAGVNVGIGAHAEVGYKDGKFKFDVGASLGVGVSVDVEIDVGGMVDTVVDGAQAAWDGIKDGWNKLWDW